jgi:hypothetical protein
MLLKIIRILMMESLKKECAPIVFPLVSFLRRNAFNLHYFFVEANKKEKRYI